MFVKLYNHSTDDLFGGCQFTGVLLMKRNKRYQNQ
jgi:hypothetical protein